MREAKEEVVDRIRVLAEQCDCLQGFQVMADDLTGFGSVAVHLLEELRDDYDGRDVLLFSVRRPHQGSPVSQKGQWLGSSSSMAEIRGACNEALATALIPDLCSLYVPISAPPRPSSLPHLQYRPSNLFHTSAIVACAIDCITTPFRLTETSTKCGNPSGAVDLRSFVKLLRGRGGPNLAAASLYLPCPMIPMIPPDGVASKDSSQPDAPAFSCKLINASTQDKDGGTGGMASLTPGIFGPGTSQDEEAQALSSIRHRVMSESICLKGAMSDSSSDAPCHVLTAQRALDAALLSSRRGGGAMTRTVQHRCVTPMPIPVPLPFPCRMLTDRGTIGPFGQTRAYRIPKVGGEKGREQEPVVSTLPAMTRLSSTMAFLPLLQQVVVDWKDAWRSPGGKALLDPWGYGTRGEADEVEERIRQMVGEYEEVDEE